MENARPYIYHSPCSYAERLDSLKEQIERIDRPNVKINLDVGHLHMAAQFHDYDLLEAVIFVRPHVAHVHVHDNFGGAVHHHEKQQTHQIPFGRGDNHMPVGWGAIPIPEILSILLPAYRGMLMMELRSRYFNYIQESKENLQALLSSLGSGSTVRTAVAAAD
jgi:sugar phosphate isomerase/epimerase